MNGDKSKYHAEIKLTVEGREVRINILSDILNDVFLDIGTICSQFQPEWQNPARAHEMNKDNIGRRQAPAPPQGVRTGKPVNASSQPKAKAPVQPRPEDRDLNDWFSTGEIPICDTCGSSEFMELISFADKKTGQQRQAWKCQACNKWHWNNNDGRGR